MRLDAAKREFKARKKNLRCTEVKALLESLGFDVRDGKRAGHKLFFHDGLPDFHSGSFNCGHGKNPEVRLPYITKIISVLEAHEESLREYLGEEKEK